MVPWAACGLEDIICSLQVQGLGPLELAVIWLPDTSATRHFGTKTLQHRLKTLLHQKRGTRHFGIRSTKSWDTLDPGQFRQDTAPPVIWLKVGAEVSCCQNVLWPKCPAPSNLAINIYCCVHLYHWECFSCYELTIATVKILVLFKVIIAV